MQKAVHDCLTEEVIIVEMTPDEIAERERLIQGDGTPPPSTERELIAALELKLQQQQAAADEKASALEARIAQIEAARPAADREIPSTRN